MVGYILLWAVSVLLGALPLIIDVIIPAEIWQAMNPNNFNVYYDEYIYIGLVPAIITSLSFVLNATDRSQSHLIAGLSMAAIIIFLIVFMCAASMTFGVMYLWSRNAIELNRVFLGFIQTNERLFYASLIMLSGCLFLTLVYSLTLKKRAS